MKQLILSGARRSCLALAVSSAIALATMPSTAIANETEKRIELDQQKLSGSLVELATAMDIKIIASSSIVGDRQSPELSGIYTAQEALDTLLIATGLIAQKIESGAFVIQQTTKNNTGDIENEASADFQGSVRPSETPTERILVKGRANNLYRIDATSSGKLPTSQIDSAITITAISAELISDQGARDSQDLYRNISGVNLFSYSGVIARGFRQEEIFFDGLRGDIYAEFVVPQLFNIERLEFLKGPAGMLYGPTAPGGVFNYITKKPSTEQFAEVRAIVGTESRLGGSLELEGFAGDTIGSRLGVFFEDRDTSRFNADSKTTVIDLGFTFDVGFADLTLQGFFVDQDLGGNRLRGVPVDNNGEFIADRRWNHNEPDAFLTVESLAFQARLEGRLGDNIDWDFTFRTIDNTEDQEYWEPANRFDSTGDGLEDSINRQFRDITTEIENISLGGNAIYTADFGDIGSRTLVGFDYFDGEDIEFFALFFENVEPLSIENPVYGQVNPENYVPFTVGDAGPLFIFDNQFTRTGAYALQELTVGDFIISAGLRWDDFEDGSFGFFNPDDDFTDSRVTGRAGIVYKVRDDLSIFGQWAESFEPQGIGNQNPLSGGPFDPTEGENFEVGLRSDLLDGRVQGSLALYQITRTNIVQNTGVDADGNGFNENVAFGEVESEGVEIDITADLTPNWVLTASYAYNETVITKDITGAQGGFDNQAGGQFTNAPRNQLGFWTRYQMPNLNLAFAFGGEYVDDRVDLNGIPVPDYTVFDGSIIYEKADWRFLLRIENIFDKTYAESGFNRQNHFPGDRRTAFLETYYQF
ncbi:MAG: TonB-dependent receptor [Pseudomonadota bacterium]